MGRIFCSWKLNRGKVGEKQAQRCTKKIIIHSKLGQRSESALLNRHCLCSLATTVKGVGLTHVSPKHSFEFWLIKITAKWPVTSQWRCHISKSEPSHQKRQLWPFKTSPCTEENTLHLHCHSSKHQKNRPTEGTHSPRRAMTTKILLHEQKTVAEWMWVTSSNSCYVGKNHRISINCDLWLQHCKDGWNPCGKG